MGGSKRIFPADELQVIAAGVGPATLSGNEAEWALQSYFGRANVTLFNKYLFTATVRRDGSSRFGEENRFGTFPSIALGWNIDQESFMQDIGVISQLKLRGSWGQLGNQEMSNYGNQTTMSTTPQYILGTSQAVVPAAAVLTLGNPIVKWETTAQTNFGFDLGVLNDALTFSADYWVKNTTGILLKTPISSATGIYRNNGAFQNAAGVKNSGFEFLLGYKNAGSVINYDITATLSTVKNEVTDLGGVPNIINLVENVYQFGTYTITEVGRPMSTFYGYVADGIFQNQAEVSAHAVQSGAAPGDVRFKDLDGDNQITAKDRTYIGDPFPNFSYGLIGNISYKNLDLNLGIQGVQGKQLYNAQRAYLESMTGEFGQMSTVVNRWTGEGTSFTMPRAMRASRLNTRPSTRFVENASYLRLQNVQIGYSIPSEFSNKMGIQKLRVYFNGQNLLTITDYINYNPDMLGGEGYNDDSMNPLSMGVDMGSVPIPAVFLFGLQVTF
jgi:TonB-linked SusC/RagA family outer membrane protein